ncbi:MAG: hypothetical protein HY270_03135 [Deltaproteobacteria bacterium]|nr:hypothetical protein [Deltaproteobacteria bacterium]
MAQVAATGFMQSNSAAQFVLEQGGLGRLCVLRGAGYFVSVLNLPDKATVEGLRGWIQDSDDEAFGMVSLVRSNPQRFEMLAMSPISKGRRGDEATEQLDTTGIREGSVDNAHYAYMLQAVLTGPNVCLRGVEVTYSLP